MLLTLALTGCLSAGDANFAIKYAYERETNDDPLAVGVAIPVRLVAELGPSDKDRTRVEDAELSIADPAVARLEGETLRAVAPGDTLLTVVGSVNGVRTTATRPISVRQATRLEWRMDEQPLTADLVVLAGTKHGFGVHHFDAEGVHLIAKGIDFPVPEHATLEHGGLPGFSLVQFQTSEPGRYPLPDTDLAIQVVPPIDSWSVDGATVTLTSGGLTPYIRRPGPRLEALDAPCEVAERATGTNPLTIVQRSGPPSCRVQITLLGRTFTIDATF